MRFEIGSKRVRNRAEGDRYNDDAVKCTTDTETNRDARADADPDEETHSDAEADTDADSGTC